MEYHSKFLWRKPTQPSQSRMTEYTPINELDELEIAHDSPHKNEQLSRTQSTMKSKNNEQREVRIYPQRRQYTPESVLNHIRALLTKNKPYPCEDIRIVRSFNEFNGKSKQFERKITECEKVCRFIGRSIEKMARAT